MLNVAHDICSMLLGKWFYSFPLTSVFLCPPDCSYTCHLECERKVQLDCNQRDKELGQTPSPRSLCSSTAPKQKVNILNLNPKFYCWVIFYFFIFLLNGHDSACRTWATCWSLRRFCVHHLSKFKCLHNLPTSCWCLWVNVFLLMHAFAWRGGVTMFQDISWDCTSPKDLVYVLLSLLQQPHLCQGLYRLTSSTLMWIQTNYWCSSGGVSHMSVVMI